MAMVEMRAPNGTRYGAMCPVDEHGHLQCGKVHHHTNPNGSQVFATEGSPIKSVTAPNSAQSTRSRSHVSIGSSKKKTKATKTKHAASTKKKPDHVVSSKKKHKNKKSSTKPTQSVKKQSSKKKKQSLKKSSIKKNSSVTRHQ